MSFSVKLTEQTVHGVDVSGMMGHISSMGAHILEAIELAKMGLQNTALPTREKIDSVVVAGLGGSAIGGDLARTYASDTLPVPFVVNRGYDLPCFVNDRTLVIVSSYSGDTEESLSMMEQAIAKKSQIVCISTGGKVSSRAKQLGLPLIGQRAGMQPRAALGYSFAPILLVLAKCGLIADPSDDLTKVAAHLDTLAVTYGLPNVNDANPAIHLAEQMMHRIPVIYSAADYYEAVNLRWRGQLQENAKHLAFGNLLPEMNHNEINGWNHPIDVLQHLCVILLRSKEDEHERVSKRFAVIDEILRGKGIPVFECHAEGATRLERMFSLISLSDWTSLYLALLNGTDPTPIPSIDLLKQKMGA